MENISENVKFVNDEILGRHLVAAVEIQPGNVIVKEQPFFITTHWECQQLKCAKCFEDSYVMCKNCKLFPLCLDCTDHSKFDCEFFQNNGKDIDKSLLINNFAINAVLKLLLLMENPDTAEKCQLLVPHNFKLDEYRESARWQEDEENIVQPLLKSDLMNVLEKAKDSDDASESDLLHRLCILIDINAFEVFSKVSDDSLKGIYVQAGKMPHHCVPNVVISIDYEHKMKIYAAVTIKTGDIIYYSFTNPLMGTIRRQNYLRRTRNFECNCNRCLDPTELGTHMSSIKCKQCPGGYVTYNQDKWLCEICKITADSLEVQTLLNEVCDEIDRAEGHVSKYEEVLRKYSSEFHPNHFLMIDLKQNIATFLKKDSINTTCMQNRKFLKYRLDLCAHLIQLVRAVLPGYSKIYANALYDYLLTVMDLTELDYSNNAIKKDMYLKNLKTAKRIANEAKELLSFESINSPEGHIVRRITAQQERIEECFQNAIK